VSGEDWEEEMLRQMVQMFQRMGISVDRDQIDQLMRQVRQQFEEVGIDLDSLPHDSIRVDAEANMEAINKALADIIKGGGDSGDLFDNLGVKFEVDAKPVTVETPTEDEDESGSIRPEELDIFVDEESIEVIVDLSRHEGFEKSDLDISLVGGETLHLMRSSQIRPFASIQLPEEAEEIESWSLNNGILAIALSRA